MTIEKLVKLLEDNNCRSYDLEAGEHVANDNGIKRNLAKTVSPVQETTEAAK